MTYEKINNKGYRINSNQNYINDNLARNIQYANTQAAPVQTPYDVPQKSPQTAPHREPKVNQTPKTATRTQNGLAGSFGFAFTGIMVACAVMLFSCLTHYISLNISINQKNKEVASLRNQVSRAVMENDNYEMAINSNIDYNYIYEVATKELGMVYAASSQIRYYNQETGEYVVQYKDVE